MLYSFKNISNVSLEDGDAFWGSYQSGYRGTINVKRVFGVVGDSVYVGDNWEGDFDTEQLVFLGKITKPWEE